jgi:hypothetical protein
MLLHTSSSPCKRTSSQCLQLHIQLSLKMPATPQHHEDRRATSCSTLPHAATSAEVSQVLMARLEVLLLGMRPANMHEHENI